MSERLMAGDRCRAKCTAPARYIGGGYCLYISSQDNSLQCDKAADADLSEHTLPLPSDEDVQAAVATIRRVLTPQLRASSSPSEGEMMRRKAEAIDDTNLSALEVIEAAMSRPTEDKKS